jgi:hypothetical protein
MDVIFPLAQWGSVILIGLAFGVLSLRYLLNKPRWFVLLAGWVFYMARLPFEDLRPDRVLGAALLWTVFSLAIFAGDEITRRRLG